MWIKRLIKRGNVFPKVNHQVKKAFTCGGIDYYEFEDAFNIPYNRGLKAVTFFEEVRMKCTLEFLVEHTKAVDKLLHSNKIDIFKIKGLNDQLNQRLTMVYDEDILYKFASVWFFDESEDPTGYDFKYAHKKIDHWKKHSEPHEFFFQLPILRLLPFLKDYEENFLTYSMVQKQISKMNWESLREVSLQD